MRGLDMKNGGPHTFKRYETLRNLMEEKVWKILEPVLGQRETDNIYHDFASDIMTLAYSAARWEDHCRKTGQNPLRWTNQDGTIDSGD